MIEHNPSAPRSRSVPLLLVSVRSTVEAQEALAGGADVVDVKEPARGALGPADWSEIQRIAALENWPADVSLTAALGELADLRRPAAAGSVGRLWLLKIGLARQGQLADWRQRFLNAAAAFRALAPVIPAAYADWQLAGSPPIDAVIDFAIEHRLPFVLIDTYVKGTHDLWSWLAPAELAALCRRCRAGGVRLAAAGSLSLAALDRLVDPLPEVLAFRGAACRAGDRRAPIDRQRVAALKARVAAVGRPSQAVLAL